MPTVGVAEVLIRPSFKGFQSEVGKQVDGAAGASGESAGRTMGSRLGGALKVGAVAGAGAAIAGIGTALTKGFGRLQAIEQARAKLTGLGHDAATVEKIMENANAGVKGTAFGLGDAASAAASAVASGVKPGKDLERTLKLIGDASTIAGTDYNEMASIFNKVSASGVIQGEELAQLGDRGIPILQLLGEEMGVTAAEVKDLASQGKVDFATFQAAMEGGMGGAAQKSGETLQGAVANSMAALGRFGANLISGVYPQVRDFFAGFIEWMGPLEEKAKVVGEALGRFVETTTKGLQGLFDLLIKGDFTKNFREAFGVEEDHPLVGFLFRVREGILNVISYVQTTVIPALQNMWRWLDENRWVIAMVAGALGGLLVYLVALKIVRTVKMWIDAAKLAFMGLNAVMRANPIGIIITVIGLLVGALIWLYNNNEDARRIMDAAWQGIKNAISFAWNNVIKPAFEWIANFCKNVLGPIFVWLYENVIKPVWGFIKTAIQVAWGVIETIFLVIKWYIENILAPVFRWIYENIIKPVWDKVAGKIKDVWEKKVKPIFEALGKFIEEKVKPAFKRGVDAIGDIWQRIQQLAAKPINFVIDTVYNNGLRKAMNKVREIVGGDPLPKVPLVSWGQGSSGGGGGRPLQAFAKGGLAKRGWALVGEEGPELVNFSQPGRVYTAAETQNALGLSDEGLRRAAGSGPSEAMLPVGGFLGDIWSGAKKAFSAATSWVRGGLASAAGLVLNPIKEGISALLPDTGLGEITSSAVRKTIDGALAWIRGEDDKAVESGLAVYDGPLGSFHRPSAGPYTSKYGPRWGGFHAGIDIAGGGPTFAALNGLVQRVGWNVLSGRTGVGILLSHGDGFQTYYGHNPVGGPQVKVGQKVKAGQHIGYQGATGNVTGTHLHFETLRNGAHVDPMQYLLRDKGGNLPPGLNLVLNKTGKDEWIMNDRQMRAMRGGGSVSRDLYINGNVGYDPVEIIRMQERADRRASVSEGVSY